MGMPSVNITFASRAASAITRSQKGVVALIIKDSKSNGPFVLTGAEQVPAALGVGNQDYVRRAFAGYVNQPAKVLLYVLPSAATELTDAFAWLATRVFDYLAGPSDATEAETAAMVAWVKGRRQNDHAICKAVLPDTAADSEAVVNFVTADIKVGAATYTAAQYCSRIAGLIAGTPMTISATYATLSEVGDVKRLSKEEMDAAEEAGKLLLFHDGEKVKTGRAVNSLQTVTAEKGAPFKKIKLVEAMDMIQSDIRTTIQDSYIGKYANSYDNKCVLITAIKGYLDSLEAEGILQAGASSVAMDMEAQTAYLQGQGVDTSQLSEQQLKEANTGAKVFLRAGIKILDAIEDIDLDIAI